MLGSPTAGLPSAALPVERNADPVGDLAVPGGREPMPDERRDDLMADGHGCAVVPARGSVTQVEQLTGNSLLRVLDVEEREATGGSAGPRGRIQFAGDLACATRSAAAEVLTGDDAECFEVGERRVEAVAVRDGRPARLS